MALNARHCQLWRGRCYPTDRYWKCARQGRAASRRAIRKSPHEPKAVGEVHLHLAAQGPLRADREYVTGDEHPDHEHRINRRTAGVGIVRRQCGVNPRQVENGRYLAHQMIGWHRCVEIKRIK